MSNFDKLKLMPLIEISKGSSKSGPVTHSKEFRKYGIKGTYDLYDKNDTKVTLTGSYKKSSGKDKFEYPGGEAVFEGESPPDKFIGITFKKKFKRGGDVMPPRNKKNFRSTKSGAGMTAAGVARYRRDNPGSKLKTAVTGKVKPGSKAAKRRKSYCARSAGQMKKFPKAARDPNSRLRQARRRWKC
jgi:hypothetical protein